jgi:TRAP-type C4-dicarboxylate transport system permease small subunit
MQPNSVPLSLVWLRSMPVNPISTKLTGLVMCSFALTVTRHAITRMVLSKPSMTSVQLVTRQFVFHVLVKPQGIVKSVMRQCHISTVVTTVLVMMVPITMRDNV